MTAKKYRSFTTSLQRDFTFRDRYHRGWFYSPKVSPGGLSVPKSRLWMTVSSGENDLSCYLCNYIYIVYMCIYIYVFVVYMYI